MPKAQSLTQQHNKDSSLNTNNGIRWVKRTVIALGLFAAVLALGVWLLISQVPSVLQPAAGQPKGVLFSNVRVLSMADDSPIAHAAQDVLVMGDTITAIGAVGELAALDGVLVIDGQGHTLMPGLIDAHIHLNDELELAAYLAHGVTGVRNMSGYPFHLRLTERAAKGQLLAPDFITTGPILNSPGPNQLILQTTVTSADEARLTVRAQHRAGYRHIKVYSNLTLEAFDAVIDEAQLLGMTVSGHSPEGERSAGMPRSVPFSIAWEASLGRGLTTLEHIETIVWHGLRDNLDRDQMTALAATLEQSGEAVTPTLYAHKRLVLIAESQGAYLSRPGSDMINPLVTWFASDAQQFWSQMDTSGYEAPHAEFFLTATGLLHEAGVPLLTGTDSGSFGIIPGASVTRELELLLAAGLSPYQALRSATRVNAEVLGFANTGMIAPGYRANLVLLAGDPLADIAAVESPVGVMVGGHWLDSLQLAAMKSAAAEGGVVAFLWSLVRVVEMVVY